MCEERVPEDAGKMVLRVNDQEISIADYNREYVQYVHVFGLKAEQC